MADLPPASDGSGQAPRRPKVSGEVLAFVLSLIWLAMLVAAYQMLGGQGMQLADTLGLVIVALAVFLPVALIWLAVLVLRAARDMRDQSARLQATVEGMRRGWIRDQQAAGLALKPTVEEKLDEIAEAQRQTETQIAMFTTRRGAAPVRRPGTDALLLTDPEGGQSVLALENPLPPRVVLGTADFIRALHFPADERDEEGFAALRRALADHDTGELIRAAQDVLTTLSEEGIYMDDLRPDRARPEIWRAFANGARGHEVSAMGGIRDRSCLALTAGRMRSDTAFRDAAHRFLRAFDRAFVPFETDATDSEINALAETRSARAFMLIGRVSRVFG